MNPLPDGGAIMLGCVKDEAKDGTIIYRPTIGISGLDPRRPEDFLEFMCVNAGVATEKEAVSLCEEIYRIIAKSKKSEAVMNVDEKGDVKPLAYTRNGEIIADPQDEVH